MKIKKLLYATLFSTIWMPAMLHASDRILEFDALQEKSQDEIFTAFNGNWEKARSCIDYLRIHKLEEANDKLQQENRSYQIIINQLNEENKWLKSHESESHTLVQKLNEAERLLAKNMTPEEEVKAYEKLKEENEQFNQKMEMLSYQNTIQNRSIDTLLQTINELSPGLKKCCFTYNTLFSQVNSQGDRVQNYLIWQELLNNNNSLLSNILQEEQSIKYLEKELYNISTNVSQFNDSLLHLEKQLKDLEIPEAKIREISDHHFTLTVQEQLEKFTPVHTILQEMKKGRINVNAIALKTLHGKILDGINASGNQAKCRCDANFISLIPYFNPAYQRIHSADTLLNLLITPANSSKAETSDIVNNAYAYILKEFFPNLNFDRVAKALDNQALNGQLISKILLCNLQFSSLIACEIWHGYTQYDANFWHSPMFIYKKNNAIESLNGVEKTLNRVCESYQLGSENLINMLRTPTLPELILSSNSASKCSILEELNKKIDTLTDKIERLRENDTFNLFWSERCVPQEQVNLEWLLDKVIGFEIIPEH